MTRARAVLRALVTVFWLEAAGAAAISYGAWLVHTAAGFITAGVLLILMANRIDDR